MFFIGKTLRSHSDSLQVKRGTDEFNCWGYPVMDQYLIQGGVESRNTPSRFMLQNRAGMFKA